MRFEIDAHVNAGRFAMARKSGSVFPPHSEHLLPADAHRLRADVAGDDSTFYMGPVQMLFLDLPLIAASFWSISPFYLVAQRELHPTTWKPFWLMPALLGMIANANWLSKKPKTNYPQMSQMNADNIRDAVLVLSALICVICDNSLR